jgi:hypothetical protein
MCGYGGYEVAVDVFVHLRQHLDVDLGAADFGDELEEDFVVI